MPSYILHVYLGCVLFIIIIFFKIDLLFFFFDKSKGILLEKRKAPQKYIGYIQEKLLARKRKEGKKIRITKIQRGRVSRSLRIQGIQERG